MMDELSSEACPEHELYGLVGKAIARKDGRDDFLFYFNSTTSPLYVIHLTWRKESSPHWSSITPFESKEDFIETWERIYD